MNLPQISTRLGKGIARPNRINIRKWSIWPVLSLSANDVDAVPFFLYKKQGCSYLITGSSEDSHTTLLERIMRTSIGDEVFLLEGRLWIKRKAIVFTASSIQTDRVCVLQKMLNDYEGIDISDFTIYSEDKGAVFSIHLNTMYAEETIKNIDQAVHIAQRHETYYEYAERMVSEIKGTYYMKDCYCHKFLPGFTRWVYEYWTVNYTMIMGAIEDTPYDYDGNFNELSYDEFTDTIQDKINALKTKLRNMITISGECRYEIIPILDFKSCVHYQDEASWCILNSNLDYDCYTDEGQIFYFCRIKNQELLSNIKDATYLRNPSLLSMIAVQINRFGFLESVTDKENNPIDIDEKGLSQLIGANFFDVFKPREIS